jgi:hypothetical protein
MDVKSVVMGFIYFQQKYIKMLPKLFGWRSSSSMSLGTPERAFVQQVFEDSTGHS